MRRHVNTTNACQKQREEYEKVWNETLEALPVEKVWPEAIAVVNERLAQGVAGRSEAQWRSLLSDAVDEEVEEIHQQWKRREERARAFQQDDVVGYSSEASAIEHWRACAIDTVLEELIARRLKDAGGDDWTSLLRDARSKKMGATVIEQGEAQPQQRSFWISLDELEHRYTRVGSTENDTANVMAIASSLIQALFSVGDAVQNAKHGAGKEKTIPSAAECLALCIARAGWRTRESGRNPRGVCAHAHPCPATVHGRHGFSRPASSRSSHALAWTGSCTSGANGWCERRGKDCERRPPRMGREAPSPTGFSTFATPCPVGEGAGNGLCLSTQPAQARRADCEGVQEPVLRGGTGLRGAQGDARPLHAACRVHRR